MPLTVQRVLTAIFGSRNDRLLKRYRSIVAKINEIEPKIQDLTDELVDARTQELSECLKDKKYSPEQILPQGLAIIRESMDRNIGIRQICNPEEDPCQTVKFDPDALDDEMLELYDEVQRRMIQTGEP